MTVPNVVPRPLGRGRLSDGTSVDVCIKASWEMAFETASFSLRWTDWESVDSGAGDATLLREDKDRIEGEVDLKKVCGLREFMFAHGERR